MRTFSFTFLFFLSFISLKAQGLYQPVSLEERVQAADFIVEAEVKESRPVLHANGKVYTHHVLEIYRIFKGEPISSAELITLGGQAGDVIMQVFPSLQVEKGQKGMFFLQKSPVKSEYFKEAYQAYADRQGFVLKLPDGRASDGIQVYSSYESEFLSILRQHSFLKEVIIKKEGPVLEKPAAGLVPSIISFTPSSIAAGEFQMLTINGVGFGSYGGQADVRFRNADDGGISFVSTPQEQIISWTDNQIVVEVPFRAGTGSFMVVDQNGSSTLSNTDLNITYDIINLQTSNGIKYTRLVDVNTLGGLSFIFNKDFYNNTGARDAFNRALETWRCGTFVNYSSVSNTTDSSCNSRNNLSTVSFDNNCPLDPGVLGRAYSYYTLCQDEDPELVEVDVVFDEMPSNGWHFGATPPPGTESDFESVALHELGHAHQMGHVIDANAVMHYALPAGTARKSLGPNDVAGGNSIMSRSTKNPACGFNGMQALTSNNCQFTLPEANFSFSPNKGCVPFDVQFTDLSTGQISSWAWDFDNDGTVDATTPNPVYTYATPGIYSVRLIVANANGADTLTRINAIQAFASPTADAGPDQSICPDESVVIGGNPTGSGGTGFLRYTWSPEDGLSNAVLANPTASPQSTIEYTVEVRDDNGCTARDSMLLTVLTGPQLDIGGDQTLCEGDTLWLINKGSNPAGTTFRWTPSDGIADPSSDSTFLVATGASYTLTLSAMIPNGCQAQASIVLTIRKSPVVDAGEDQESCRGTGVEIGGHPAASGGAGGYTYLWQPFDGLSNSGVANPIADPASTTTYTLTVFDALGCSGRDTVRVRVHPAPQADAGPDQGPICAGESVLLGGNPAGSGGTGSLHYSWRPSQYLDTLNKANPIATPPESTVFIVIVSDDLGCRDEDSAEVTVYPSPNADAGRDTILCGPGEVMLGGSPAVSGGTAPLSISWSPSSSLHQNDVPNPMANVSESTIYTLTVVDANNCTASDLVMVSVLPPLQVDAGADDTLCYGECAVLGGQPVATGGSGSGYLYEWEVAGNIFSNAEHPEICPAATESYLLTVRDDAGCEASDEVRIVIKNYQPISFRTVDSSYCDNDGYDSLIAFPVGGLFSGEGVKGNGFYPARAGLGEHWIYYEYITGNGCLIRDSFRTEVRPAPAMPVIGQKADTLYTSDTFYAYEWLFNGVVLPNTDRPFYVAPASGNYQVRVYNENGCDNVSEIYSYAVGITKLEREMSLDLYPVPNDGHFVLRMEGDLHSELKLEVFDLSGRQIYIEYLNFTGRRMEIDLTISNQAAGMYYLRLTGEDGQITKKVSIVR